MAELAARHWLDQQQTLKLIGYSDLSSLTLTLILYFNVLFGFGTFFSMMIGRELLHRKVDPLIDEIQVSYISTRKSSHEDPLHQRRSWIRRVSFVDLARLRRKSSVSNLMKTHTQVIVMRQIQEVLDSDEE